ncbi:hypothetical protein KHQ88_00990 [Mycoplasmatota bacterium]|nr:hypothetical protein KHQ88_00990 [Mycoplasmatota bacterium]
MKKVFKKTLDSMKRFILFCYHYFKKHYVKIGFYFLAFILFINAIFMTVYLINRNYDYKIVDTLYIEAILPNQDINSTLKTGIVKIKKIDYDRISTDDQVVMCCAYGLDEFWVQDVVSVNKDDKVIQTSYDDFTFTLVNEDDAYGVYIEEANIFVTMYYTSSFIRGYALWMVSEILFIYIYHFVFIQKRLKGVLKKNTPIESAEEDENI